MSSPSSQSEDCSHYHLIEVERGAKLTVLYDKEKIVPHGAKRTCSAAILRGFAFPGSLLKLGDKNLTPFAPVESLGHSRTDSRPNRTWRRYEDHSCIYVVASTDATIHRDLFVGESAYLRAYLRSLKLLPDSNYHRLLRRLRQRRQSPTWFTEFLQGGLTL